MGDAGLERPPLALSKTEILDKGGANSGALDAPEIPKNESAAGCKALIRDPELMQVISAWPKLPDVIRKKILLLSGQGKQENVKLIWGKQGYEKTVVDTTEDR